MARRLAQHLRTAALLSALAVAVAGCGDTGDRIMATADPCIFVLDFATRCTPAGKTSICTRRRPVMVRDTAPSCQPA